MGVLMMSLLQQLSKDMVTAMKEKDKATLSVVRMLKAAVQNEQIAVGHDLTPDEENARLGPGIQATQGIAGRIYQRRAPGLD
jgi:hypothetical protein